MGLRIDNNLVEVDDTHNQYLNTGIQGNPVINNHSNGMVVYSVFKRNKAPGSARGQHGGDNCPLLYALKKKNGMRTNVNSIKKLVPVFYKIVNSHINHGYDLVVPMPSNHNICKILSDRLVGIYGCHVAHGLFVKISIQDAESQLDSNATLTAAEKKSIRFKLKGQAKAGAINFSLKDIPTADRHVFDPVKVNKRIIGQKFSKILLVDDLYSSGRTLECAHRHVVSMFPGAQVEALCLFSKSNGK